MSTIPRRSFGNTELQVSVLGLGGFHQVEIGQALVTQLVDRYLEAGGNYVETARSYGGGVSEIKLGRALQGRRDQVLLVSKTGQRDAEGAWRELNASLEALGTDHLDVLLYHGVSDIETLDRLAGPGGAGEAFARAREEGLVRLVGASSHWPLVLIPAMERLELDAVMYWVNYLVPCNYPELYARVAPVARERGCAIIGMKPLGDGYLYRSVGPAFAYALAQEVDVLACGFNSLETLEADIQAVCAWERPTAAELEAILRDAPELGDYICRQCGACRLPEVDLSRVFELEGKFDRQMFDGRPTDAPDYALRQRLQNWFNNRERATELYRPLSCRVQALLETHAPLPICPYGIDLDYKLRLAHAKLSGSGRFPSGEYTF
jgi:predicted aldo/keto reductase-like oxidoreductase